MKKLLFILILWGISPVVTHAQCAIYADDNTGAFGAGFNNDNLPTTMQECIDVAIKKCKQEGGTNCTVLFKGTKSGWYGLISGFKADGRRYFQGTDGCKSKTEAENAARKAYINGGGTDPYKVQIYTWYAYSNVKL